MANTINSTASVSQGISNIVYSGSIDLTGNLEDTHTTQWMLAAEANNVNAGYFSKASGGAGTAGDVQISIEYSNDKVDANAVAGGTLVADHDAVVNQDALLGGTNYEEFKSYKWFRLSADGQASNDYTTIDWSVCLTKNEGVTLRSDASLQGAAVANEV